MSNKAQELQDLDEAYDRIDRWKRANHAKLSELSALVSDYNSARANAEKYIRRSGEDCDTLKVDQTRISYDADALVSSVGEDYFMELGGTVALVRSYKIDKATLEKQIAANALPQEIVELICKVSYVIKGPPTFQVP